MLKTEITMSKEVKESMSMMFHEIKTINKKDIIKIQILEFK